jgi:hypothetical protein
MRYAEIKGFALYPYLDSITKKVYGARAIIGNPEITHHYSRAPLESVPVNDRGYYELTNEDYFSDSTILRDDPALIRVVEELGVEANGRCSELTIVEIPEDVRWIIAEYDGKEHIDEIHRTWG